MSIIIQGLSIPDKTIRIVIDSDGSVYQEIAYPMSSGFRLKPLGKVVEVPTPHGRLIDADIVTHVIANMMPSWTTPDGTGQYDREISAVQEAFVDNMQTIIEQPTVIEAEGD